MKNLYPRATFPFLAASIAILFGCTKNQPVHEPTPMDSQKPLASAAHVHREHWTCTMHPQIDKEVRGTCPICGMGLVKRVNDSDNEDEEATQTTGQLPGDHAGFKLSLGRQQMIGVKWDKVEKKTLFRNIRAAGRLAFDPELYTAQSEYVEAIQQRERVKDSPVADVKHSSDRMVESAKLRLKILGLSDPQISQIAASGSSGSNLLINKRGENAWVYAEVYEVDLPYIHPGMSAEISANFLGGTPLAGKVIAVDRVINPATRTAKVRITVMNGKANLRPESYVDVLIHSPMGEQVVVPFDAVLDTGNQSWVFVTNGQGQFDPKLVTIKFRSDDEIAIASGLIGGEQIVTSANFLIDSESRLKGALEAFRQKNSGQNIPGGGSKTSAPACPSGEHWDVPMSMCMRGSG